MKKSVLTLCVFVLLLLLIGCNRDEMDFKKLSTDVNLHPEFVAPIAKSNISAWDLVQSQNNGSVDVIQKDQNGLIKIVYKQNGIVNYNVRDLIQFPVVENFSSGDKVVGEILLDDINISTSITLTEMSGKVNGALDGIIPFNGMNSPFPPVSVSNMNAHFILAAIPDFTSITLSKGTVQITLENNLKVPLTIDGSLYDVGSNREISKFNLANIAPNATKTTSVSLAGVQLSNQIEFRITNFDTPGSLTPVNINMADYFKMTFGLSGLAISKGNLKITKSLSIEGSAGEFNFNFPEPDLKAFSAVLKKGSLTINFANSSQMTGAINFKLSEIKKNGVPLEATIPLAGNSTTIDLSGAVINFSADPAFPFNRIPYVYSLMVNSTPGFINYSSTDKINVDVALNGIEFKSITGDFGKRSISIDKNNFNLNVDLLDKFTGHFKLANPSLVLTIHNSLGLPGTLEIGFSASNKDGVVVPLQPSPFDLPVPANINAGIASKNMVLDKGNSQIVDFLALPPTGKILYSGKVEFNKTNVVTVQNPNFMDMDATFGMDLSMELPMELQINKLGFKDTTSISGSSFKNFESADLILNATNGIPLDIDMQLFYIDTISKKQYGASKGSRILSAAQVNSKGEITPVQSSQTFSLTKTDLENLSKANGLVFSGTVSSPDSGTTVAPLYSTSEIKLNVVIKSKINL